MNGLPRDVLNTHLYELKLPEEMAERTPECSARVVELMEVASTEINERGRRFIPGLLMAFISMAEEIAILTGRASVDDVLEVFDHQEFNNRGQRVNTLNLVIETETFSGLVHLRPRYNAAEHVFKSELRRYDYPNMAPHATQAWEQHRDLLKGVFRLEPTERRALAEATLGLILALPEFGRRSAEDAKPRPFETLLGLFPNTQKGEPPGAVLQGLSFAYFRADSPNVTIETGKVGAGSKRSGRIGDVDGWSGPELVLSIEVKDEDLKDEKDPTLDGFIANLAEWPDAVAIVVSKSASPAVREGLGEQAVKVLTRDSMLEAAVRWDLDKQLIAAREFYYYLARVQRHSGLLERYEAFLDETGITL